VIGAPLSSSPCDLVIAQCKAGVVGSFPALNARPALLDEWLARIKEELAAYDRARIPSVRRRRCGQPDRAQPTIGSIRTLRFARSTRCVDDDHPLGARESSIRPRTVGMHRLPRRDQPEICPQGVEKGADGLILVSGWRRRPCGA
jgi:nitronate monooxygenase